MNKYKIESLDTQKGEVIIYALRKNKWKLISQYSRFAFDKGIDYDNYLLKKCSEELFFEWSNWFEWQVIGSRRILDKLVRDFSLEQEVKKESDLKEELQ